MMDAASPSAEAGAAPAVAPDAAGQQQQEFVTFSKRHRVFVGGIATQASEVVLASYFGVFGKVIECKVVVDNETAKSKGYAFVTFEDEAVAERVRQCGLLYYLGKLMNTGEVMRAMKVPRGPDGQPVPTPPRRNFIKTAEADDDDHVQVAQASAGN